MDEQAQVQPTVQERVRKFIAEDHKRGWDEAWSVVLFYRDGPKGRILMIIISLHAGKLM